MARGSGVAADPLVLGSSDEDSAHGGNGGVLVESDSSDIEILPPPMPSRIPPLDDSTRNGNSPRSGILGPRPTVSTPPKASQRLTNMQNMSGLQIEASPSSLSKKSTSTPKRRLQFPAVDRGRISPADEPQEDEGEEGDSQILRASSDTPSKKSSRGAPKTNSQNSVGTSIGSSSPLVSRLKQKLSTSKLKENHPSISSLEDSLHGFEEGMREDHALTVRWLLNDSKEAVVEAKPLFMDKVSPFAAMKSVQVLPGEIVPSGMTTLKLDSYVNSINKKKTSKTKSEFFTEIISSDMPRVPKYSNHQAVKRNILSADDEKLKFIPFLEKGNEPATDKQKVWSRLVKELEAAYTANSSISSRESERACRIRSYLNDWLESLDIGCDHNALIQYILNEDDLGLKSKDRNLLLKSFNKPLKPDVMEMASRFCRAFENVFDISLKDVILLDDRLKEMVEFAKKIMDDETEQRVEAPADRYGTYSNLTCLICGALCCQTHGDYSFRAVQSEDSENSDTEGKEDEYVYTHQRVAIEYDGLLRKHEERQSNKPEAYSGHVAPCSDQCYLALFQDLSTKDYDWDPWEIDTVRKMLVSLPNIEYRACSIAFILHRPCKEVYAAIQEEAPNGNPKSPLESPEGRTKRPDWYDNRRKALLTDWTDKTKAHLHQERTQANPCSHAGPCKNDCPCFNTDLLCETMCACPDDCPRRFTGCSCLSAGMTCNSETCICIQMNRECGPTCSSCGAIPRSDPINRYNDDLFSTGCQNVMLQRGVQRCTVIGESQLEGVGFGLYAGEPIKKGEYISEYAGEVISGNEAERRGIIYDRRYLSFLFDLNYDWAVDGARLGNETRFINHADNEKDGLNCEAKILLVNGEHRIKFIALRDIAVGEELFFNYGKKFAEKHGLSKKLPKAKEGSKKGVVYGKEALEALDGLDSRNRVTRGKMTAIRGGHAGGRGGKKARKTAPIRDALAAAVEEVVEDGDSFASEVYEEDDDEGRDGRRKRKITRPSRYSR